ncbi:MAG: hypothetical protein ACKPJJ_34670, partial [Planctomycetaceae bacterium]
MPVLHILYDLLAKPAVYRMWQAPFADAKFEPILRHNDLQRVRHVLDAESVQTWRLQTAPATCGKPQALPADRRECAAQ